MPFAHLAASKGLLDSAATGVLAAGNGTKGGAEGQVAPKSEYYTEAEVAAQKEKKEKKRKQRKIRAKSAEPQEGAWRRGRAGTVGSCTLQPLLRTPCTLYTKIIRYTPTY